MNVARVVRSVDIFFADKFSVPSAGMYIPLAGTYVPWHGTEIFTGTDVISVP